MSSFGYVTGADGQVYTRTSEPDWLLNSNKHSQSNFGLPFWLTQKIPLIPLPAFRPTGLQGVSAASLGYAAHNGNLQDQEQLNQVYQPQLQSYMQGDPTGGYMGANAIPHAGTIFHQRSELPVEASTRPGAAPRRSAAARVCLIPGKQRLS